jgi:Tfp pilus assembly protein PilN
MQSMIEINLLPGKKKRAAAGFTMPEFGEILGKVRDPFMVAAVGVCAVVVALVAVIFVTESAKTSRLRDEVESVTAEARRFNTLIRDKERQERLRDSLVIELQAIREIDADRYIWAHVMEEVTKALPDFTWLVNLEFLPAPAVDMMEEAEVEVVEKPPVRFALAGRTADIGAYTRFLRNLATSPWLVDVQPGPTETVLEDERPVTAFTINATYQQADSAFIRTAPVQESVR